jgi:hypothetical protein
VRSSVLARALLAAGVVVTVGVADNTSAAGARSRVHPNAVVTIADMNCKVGLLLHRGKRVYAGIPASCTALPLDEGKLQNGCVAATAPIGTPARIAGAKHRTKLVYNSFTRMQQMGVKRHNECDFNDLALLKLKKKDAKAARGAVPRLSAPKSVSSNGPKNGSMVTFGSARTATAGATKHNGWVYELSAAPSVSASDVGTPVTQDGHLLGMLTAIPVGTVSPSPAAVYNIDRAIKIARQQHKFRHLKLLKAGQKL